MDFKPDGDLLFQLNAILNQGISFAENMDGALIEFTTTDSEQQIRVGMSHVPSGFFILLKTGECDIWAARLLEWNTEYIFLKSNMPDITIRLFVF